MISRILGFDNSKSATLHWLMQRISAIILIPLSFRFMVFLNLCMNAPYQETLDWLKLPLNMLTMIAWLLAVFYHAAIGLQVVVEDYVANQPLQAKLVKGINLSFIALTIIGLAFLIRIL